MTRSKRLIGAVLLAMLAVSACGPSEDPGLGAAIALYRARGYREVPPFNREPFATHWMEKALRG